MMTNKMLIAKIMMEMKLANPVNQAVIMQAIHGMMLHAQFQNTQKNKPQLKLKNHLYYI